MIPVGDLLPDLPDRDNPGVIKAENVVPLAAAYGSFRGIVEDTNALANRCRGARPLKDFSGVVFNYAGDASQLYERSGLDYVAKGTGYTLTTEQYWEFISFNGKAYACGGYEPLQEATMGASFADTAVDGDSGAPPQAQHADVVREFIVTGNQTLNPHEVIWSAIGRADKWPGGAVADPQQAGSQVLQQGGEITRVVGGEYGIIFCEHAIYRMNYQGAPIVFSFDNVVNGKGTVASGSVVQIGHLIYYLDVDGFYLFNGSETAPIGSNTFNRTFINDMLDTNYPWAMSGIADLENTLIFWSYVSKDSPVQGIADRVICYNWTTKKFSGPINIPTEQLVYSLTPGVDSDDVTVGAALSDGDEYGHILSDGSQFKGGDRATISAFTLDHKHGDSSGDVLTGCIETGEYSLNPGGYAHVTGVRPIVDGNSPEPSISLGFRDTTNGPVNYTGSVQPNKRTELAPFRQNNRYHRLRVIVEGDFDRIIGFEPVVIGSQTQ